MTLEFLSPDPAGPNPPRSPLLDVALAAGAVTEVRDGWEGVAFFGDAAAEAAACADSVGFADLSGMAKLELQVPAQSAPADEFNARTAQRIDARSRWQPSFAAALADCELERTTHAGRSQADVGSLAADAWFETPIHRSTKSARQAGWPA